MTPHSERLHESLDEPSVRLAKMDRAIEKPRWSAKTLMTATIVVGCSALLIWLFVKSQSTSLTIDPSRLQVSRVTAGEFVEFIPILGRVEPINTVFLDAVEGGQVQEIFVDDGHPINKGDPILRLANAMLQKDSISTESRLLENINTLRNTRINLAEKELILKEQHLDNEYQISLLEKQHQRYSKMMVDNPDSLSELEFERITDELAYRREKSTIINARIDQERELREQQLAQVDDTIRQVNHNLEVVRETLDFLNVRAPISGHLSTLKVELGQNILRGENIGQIDQLDAFKVRSQVDQHYISKVEIGQVGDFQFADRRHRLRVDKVYPEVTNDVFEIDLAFVDAFPEGLKRGQSVQTNLSLSGASSALVMEKGGFHRSTGGRWVYVVSADGSHAVRRDIRLGRQNPRHFEVLEGLEANDVVITSSYDGFNTADVLSFSTDFELPIYNDTGSHE